MRNFNRNCEFIENSNRFDRVVHIAGNILV